MIVAIKRIKNKTVMSVIKNKMIKIINNENGMKNKNKK